MSLPAPTAVACAIAGGQPTDAREHVTVDLAGAPSAHRRGFAVYTEALTRGGRSTELARHARESILHELRTHPRQPADALLTHAFSVANAIVFEDGRNRGPGGEHIMVGATAIIFDANEATVAHVPPGQFMLAQDGVMYAVPELDAWSEKWVLGRDSQPAAEPFGYADWTSPLLIRTELMTGDTVVLGSGSLGRLLAESSQENQSPIVTASSIHAHDPDKVLDRLRGIMMDADEEQAVITVIGFPPDPHMSEIATIADVGRNAREQWRRGQAATRSMLRRPTNVPPADDETVPDDDLETIRATPVEPVAGAPSTTTRQRRRLQDRLTALVEGIPEHERNPWRKPSDIRQFGAPGAHGVNRFRGTSLGGDDRRLRHSMPRAPFVRSPWFIGAMVLLVCLLGWQAWDQRDRFLPDPAEYVDILADVDQRLVRVGKITDPTTVDSELAIAEKDLAKADSAGAPDDALNPRLAQITLERDRVHGVFRLQDVSRIGGLPSELQDSGTSVVWANGAIFLSNGSLYRLRVEPVQMQLVLQEGKDAENVTVGNLYGVAFDGQNLFTTDGTYMYFAGSTEGTIWQSQKMQEINQQGAWPRGPIAAFSQSMYVLESGYRNIYRFDADPEKKESKPYDWVLTGDRVDFNMARDIAVDGNIYVLIEDGRVFTMKKGAYQADLSFEIPSFNRDSEEVHSIVNGAKTGYLYIAIVNKDEGTGRIVAVDHKGGHMVQMELPATFNTGGANVLSPFEKLQDFAVDEDTGTLYVINGDAVWSAHYGLPALPSAPATPGTTPVAEPLTMTGRERASADVHAGPRITSV